MDEVADALALDVVPDELARRAWAGLFEGVLDLRHPPRWPVRKALRANSWADWSTMPPQLSPDS